MSTECIKRKRGRPRRDEQPDITESDLTLIQEFASRPAFYDRACVHYRNRDYLEQQWQEMAQNLGCKVSAIKIRMQHLRTRYYTEKRRLELQQDQYNSSELVSNWPLYEYMNFLGDHIKTRRSYNSNNTHKALQCLALDQLSPNSNLSDETNSEDNIGDTEMKHKVNGDIRISNISAFNGNSEPISVNVDPLTMPQCPIRSKRLLQKQQEKNTHMGKLSNGVAPSKPDKSPDATQNRAKYANIYRSFGQFLTASLIEMEENVALQLVNKFTSELVQSLHIEKAGHRKDNAENGSETPDENVSN